jgi:hypothetical protein
MTRYTTPLIQSIIDNGECLELNVGNVRTLDGDLRL